MFLRAMVVVGNGGPPFWKTLKFDLFRGHLHNRQQGRDNHYYLLQWRCSVTDHHNVCGFFKKCGLKSPLGPLIIGTPKNVSFINFVIDPPLLVSMAAVLVPERNKMCCFALCFQEWKIFPAPHACKTRMAERTYD